MRVGVLGAFVLALTAAACTGPIEFVQPQDSALETPNKNDVTPPQQTSNLSNACTSYQNQFPPCMSTWPAGSPHYRGSWPGPTFSDEQ